jgi:drug/metabolite transporter (DMT)-like permease
MHFRLLGKTLDELQISFFVNFAGLVSILPFVVYNYKHIFKSYFWPLHLIRSICTVSSNILLIYAYNNMKFAQVSAITLTYPLFSTLGAAIFLGEKIGLTRVLALIIGFIGSLIIINPNYNEFNYYSILALLAMCLWVTFDMLTRKFPNTESVLTQSFYTLLFITVIAIIPASLTNFSNIELGLLTEIPYLGVIVLLYIMSGFVAIICTEGIAVVMPFYFLVLVISSAIGYYIFHESLALSTIIGALIILVSTTYIACREYKIKKLQEMQMQGHLI